MRTLVLALLPFVVGCTTPSVDAPLRPATVLRSIARHDQQTLTVQGFLIYGSHARQLWQSESASRLGKADTQCLTLINTGRFDELLNHRNKSYVVVTGRLRSTDDPDVIDLGQCNEANVSIESIR